MLLRGRARAALQYHGGVQLHRTAGAWSKRHSVPALGPPTPIHKYQNLEIPFPTANGFARPSSVTPVP